MSGLRLCAFSQALRHRRFRHLRFAGTDGYRDRCSSRAAAGEHSQGAAAAFNVHEFQMRCRASRRFRIDRRGTQELIDAARDSLRPAGLPAEVLPDLTPQETALVARSHVGGDARRRRGGSSTKTTIGIVIVRIVDRTLGDGLRFRTSAPARTMRC